MNWNYDAAAGKQLLRDQKREERRDPPKRITLFFELNPLGIHRALHKHTGASEDANTS